MLVPINGTKWWFSALTAPAINSFLVRSSNSRIVQQMASAIRKPTQQHMTSLAAWLSIACCFSSSVGLSNCKIELFHDLSWLVFKSRLADVNCPALHDAFYSVFLMRSARFVGGGGGVNPLWCLSTPPQVCIDPRKNSRNKSKIHCWPPPPPLVFSQFEYSLYGLCLISTFIQWTRI